MSPCKRGSELRAGGLEIVPFRKHAPCETDQISTLWLFLNTCRVPAVRLFSEALFPKSKLRDSKTVVAKG